LAVIFIEIMLILDAEADLLSQPVPMIEELSRTQIEELHRASSKMTGARRRAFQAEIALKYCNGSPRLTESVFGWSRSTVETGLGEKRSGLLCVGAQSAFSGRKRWEEIHPEAFTALQKLAEAHCQQDPTFTSSIAFTRLTAASAIQELNKQGFLPEELPAPSVMAEVLNRSGYRLRKVLKAKPQKNYPKQMRSLRTSTEKIAKSMTARSSD
jgi:Rhodopirellula transposase DDE domain